MSEDATLTPVVQSPTQEARIPRPAARDPEPRTGAIALRRILTAIRRHMLLMVVVTTFTTTFALVVFRQPNFYRAEAVLRLVGERRAMVPDLEPGENLDERHVVLVNSLVPRVRSRAVIGAVVDSLGLQVRSLPMFSLLHPPSGSNLALADVRVDPGVKADTFALLFGPDYLTVRHADNSRRDAYGKPITVRGATFTVPRPPGVASALLAVDPRDVAIDRVLQSMAVVPLTGTDALDIRYLDTDPQRAMNITNGVVRTFYAATIHSSQEMARRRRLFFEGQLQESDRQLTQAQAGLSTFRSRRRVASSADKLARQQSDLMTLDTRRGDLQADRRVFGSLLARLDSAKDSSSRERLDALAYSPEIATDPVVGKVFQQLLTYRTRLDSLTSGPFHSSPTNPDLLQLKTMVGASEQDLVRAARGRVTSIDTRLAALEDLRNRNAGEMARLPTLEAEEARLGQKVSALADFSNQLRLEYEKARLAEALAAADIEIVDHATLPYLAAGVPWWTKVGLALVGGLVVSALLSVLLELKNRSIRAPEELEEALHLRGLGVIPPVMEAIAAEEASALQRASGQNGPGPQAAGLRGMVSDSPACPSVGAEAFRLLYSSLTFGWGDRRRTILITSVGPQEGKTLVASNLAVTFAREGARVLLIDCDLRRPRLHKMFQVSRAPGLVELLRAVTASDEPEELEDVPQPPEHAYSMFPAISRGEESGNGEVTADVGSAGNGSGRKQAAAPVAAQRSPHFRNIRESTCHGLWLLPCGAVDGVVAETLKAGSIRALLSELADDFDVIILDTPPALVSADAVILASVADDVLLVVQAGRTHRDAAERTYQQLSQAGGNVVGAVLNDPEGKVGGSPMKYYPYGYPVTTD